MVTKAEIVQRLLDKGLITAEEAVVLLIPTIIHHQQERIGLPDGALPIPFYPVPYEPYIPPFTITC